MTPFKGKLRTRHLEAMLAIADFGSLSKSAQHLHMTQSGLSRLLTELEEIAGGRLFERTGKGMSCTSLGEAMCQHAHILLGDLAKAEADLLAVAKGELGQLTLGCFSMFSGWPLAQAITLFRSRHPRIALSVQVGMHERMLEDLDSAKLDLLISRNLPNLDPALYRTRSLLEDKVVLACAADHPLAKTTRISLEDCAQYPWITAPPQTRVRLELETFLRQNGITLPAMIGALSLELNLELVKQGGYLCMLPYSVAQAHRQRGDLHLLPVSIDVAFPPLAAIWRREHTATLHIREFTNTLIDVIQNHDIVKSTK
ncbi:MAG: LysR family transcriptional regulator [Pigmentiphaga sp.]|nr:LysR family transcriptional regulator [Pigmentiphaga sp.]